MYARMSSSRRRCPPAPRRTRLGARPRVEQRHLHPAVASSSPSERLNRQVERVTVVRHHERLHAVGLHRGHAAEGFRLRPCGRSAAACSRGACQSPGSSRRRGRARGSRGAPVRPGRRVNQLVRHASHRRARGSCTPRYNRPPAAKYARLRTMRGRRAPGPSVRARSRCAARPGPACRAPWCGPGSAGTAPSC